MGKDTTADTIDASANDERSVAAATREGIDKVESVLQEKIDTGGEKLREVLSNAESIEGEVRDSAEQLAKSVGDYIHRNPVQSAGFAFAAGVLAAMLLSRR